MDIPSFKDFHARLDCKVLGEFLKQKKETREVEEIKWEFQSHIFVPDIYGRWDPVHLKKLWKSCALRAVWMASVKTCGRNHINLIN